jgi:hypothetical protein
MARAAGVPVGWTGRMTRIRAAAQAWIVAHTTSTGGISALVVGRFRGNSQELTTNHKNNERGGAEWTRTIRPKRT